MIYKAEKGCALYMYLLPKLCMGQLMLCMFVLLLFVDHENLLTYMKVGGIVLMFLNFGFHIVMAIEKT